MAGVMAFDTLAYSKKLQNAGMSSELADVMATTQLDALNRMIDAHELATRSDLRILQQKLEGDSQAMEQRLLNGQNEQRLKLEADNQAMEQRLLNSLNEQRLKLEADNEKLGLKLGADIKNLEKSLAAQITTTLFKFLRWLVSIGIALAGVIGAFVYWLHP